MISWLVICFHLSLGYEVVGVRLIGRGLILRIDY